MDNLRLLLFFALAMVLLLIYQAWMEDYGKPLSPPPQAAQQSESAGNDSELNGVPDVSVTPDAPTQTTPGATGIVERQAKREWGTDDLPMVVEEHLSSAVVS